jgi:hypothetical protein
VPIKNGKEEKSKEVFYLYDFLQNATSKKDMKHSYHNDMKTQVEFQTDYPQHNTFQQNGGNLSNINSADADLNVKINVREKLCSRIIKQEG